MMVRGEQQELSAEAAMTCVARQPIVDRAGRTVGYELLFRNGNSPVADVVDGFASTTEVVERTLGTMGLDTVLGGLDGYLNCTAAFLHSGVHQVLASRRFVLEVLETCELDDDLRKRCQALRTAGFRIALDDVTEITPEISAFLPAVDIVKLEWPAIDGGAIGAMVRHLKRAGKIVVAEKIDDRQQLQVAIDAGCDLIQGFYFSKPETIHARRLVPDVSQVFELLNLLIEDACDNRIIRALSGTPVLVAQLLRLANCSGTANPKRTTVCSLHHALAAIGTSRLFQWCSLLLYNHTDTGATRTDPLVALALQRAAVMLRLALFERPLETAYAQTAYLTGMLSLLHVIYGKEQHDFAQELPLDESVRGALASRSGSFGELLIEAEAFEAGRLARSRAHGCGAQRSRAGTVM